MIAFWRVVRPRRRLVTGATVGMELRWRYFSSGRSPEPGNHLRLHLLQLTALAHLRDRLVDLLAQRVALLQQDAVLLARDELPGHGDLVRAALHDPGPDRDVHHERVDLAVGERLARRAERAELARLLARLDLVRDQVAARRRRLEAELEILHVGDRLRLLAGAALGDEKALVGVEVGLAEVDDPVALGRDRDLVDGDVERLRGGREEARERRVDPLHAAGAELARERLGEVDLEALRILDRQLEEPGDRELGAGRELALGHQLDRVRLLGVRRAGLLGAAAVVVAAAGAQRHRDDQDRRQPHQLPHKPLLKSRLPKTSIF